MFGNRAGKFHSLKPILNERGNMAKLKASGVIGGINLLISVGEQVTLLGTVDNSFTRFNIRWLTPSGPVSGTLSTGLMNFTQQEIKEHDIPVDSNGLPLYRDLRVKYIGTSNNTITNGDFLIVRDLWYNGNALECQCLHHGNSRPNTDGRVVIQCQYLERA
jgi:hypothetical protein